MSKESAYKAGDVGLIPGSGRSPEGYGNPHQYSFLENPHGQRSPAGSSPKDHKKSDTTEATEHTHTCTNRDFLSPLPLEALFPPFLLPNFSFFYTK